MEETLTQKYIPKRHNMGSKAASKKLLYHKYNEKITTIIQNKKIYDQLMRAGII